MATFLAASRELGIWQGGKNLLDGGAHFYNVYQTKDKKYIAVGALESKFYSELLLGLKLDHQLVHSQMDKDSWKEMKDLFSSIFITKTRKEWVTTFKHLDACVSPIYDFHSFEASLASENVERNVFNLAEPNHLPNPSPRLSLTPSKPMRNTIPFIGEHTTEILRDILCYNSKQIKSLYDSGIVSSYPPSKI